MTWEAGMLSLHQSPKYFNQTRRLKLYSSQCYLYSTVAQIFGNILHLISAFLGVSAFSLPPSAVAACGKQAFQGICDRTLRKASLAQPHSTRTPALVYLAGTEHMLTAVHVRDSAVVCHCGDLLFHRLMSSVLTVK